MKLKKFLSLAMAAVMLCGSCVTANAANSTASDSEFSDHEHMSISKVKEVSPGGKLYSDSDTIYLKITPQYGINENDSIVLTLDNGTFDKDKTESSPYLSPANAKSYDDMMQDYHSGLPLATVLNSQLGNSGCELPYKTEYLSASQIRVHLFPINEQDCDKASNSVAYDIPYYYIPIFATAGSDNVKLSVDNQGTKLPDNFTTYIAKVNGGSEFVQESGDYTHIGINKVLGADPGEKLYSDSDSIYLKITPQYGINENDSIVITLDNGTFDKDKIESNPYLSPINRKSYDTMMGELDRGLPLTVTLNSELGTVGCELPYKMEYISENRLRVYLFPINKEDCDKYTNRVTYEKPYYFIPIYAIAGSENVKLSVDAFNVALPVGFSAYIAKVNGGSELNWSSEYSANIVTKTPSSVDPGEKLYSDSDIMYLKITPQYGINENDSIVLTLDNGTFDKDKTESIGYSSPAGGKSYDDMMQDYHSGSSILSILYAQLGSSGCELPYKTEYLSASQIKVYLFPINEQDCDKVTNRIAYDKPYYYIPIFATAGNQDVYLSIDTLNVALPYGVKKCIATVKGGTSTETTNKTGVLNENISYIFGSGKLNVTGSGEMPDMSKSDVWDDIKAGVRSAETGEGITKIGESAFEGFTSLEDMIISHDIAEIGDRAFSGCLSLKELYIPDTVTTIGALAFEGMDGAVIYNYSGVEIDQTHYGTSNVTVINASIKKGDANCDNTLTADDAEDILSKTLNIIYEPKIEHITKDIYPYVDINSDGVLTAYDAVLVLTKVLDSTFEF